MNIMCMLTIDATVSNSTNKYWKMLGLRCRIIFMMLMPREMEDTDMKSVFLIVVTPYGQ